MFLVLVFLVAGGLGLGYLTGTATTTEAPVHCPSSACVNVTITSGASSPPAGYKGNGTTTYGYSPDMVTVVIGKNNTVFWTNNDVAPHTVTSVTGDPASFDSRPSGPLTKQGGTFQFTFTVPGVYQYHCIFHAWMQGTVIVLVSNSPSP